MTNAIKNFYLPLLILCISILTLSCDKTKDPQSPSGAFELNIVHHISRDNSGGNAVTTAANIETVMLHLGNNFAAWDIKFKTKEIRFVDNKEWNIQFVKQDDFIDQKVLQEFEDEESLNIFYFDKLANRQNGEITGTLGATALFPGQGNNIKLSASAFAPSNTGTVTHEIGHYLGLYHTSDDNEDASGNIELADGSNCMTAGDHICDTPASPDLNDSNIDEPTCMYIGSEVDANGMPYTPDVFNFMTQWAGSDSDNNLCRRRFTQGQVDKMKEVLNTERAYLK